MRYWIVLLLIGCCAGCAPQADVAKERDALMAIDREWATNVKDPAKFTSYYAADATVYPPGAPLATGSGPIRKLFDEMMSTPGFSLSFAATRSDVTASGDLGYTVGTYEANMGGGAEKGKYVTIWKKQADGQWKVKEDIFNTDAGPASAPTEHVMLEAPALKWMDGPPSLPPGAKLAVVAGDPSKPGPFVIRAQTPAGYKVAPHWHPGDENLTILSGTVALGMGDTWDDSKMKPIGPGGYGALPAQMHHYFLSKTAATFQIHGMGPFVINYINPGDDPSKK